MQKSQTVSTSAQARRADTPLPVGICIAIMVVASATLYALAFFVADAFSRVLSLL